MILNVRGTNGSGKTHLGYALIKKLNGKPILDSKGKPEAYECEDDIIVVGRYNFASGYGGTDALPRGWKDGPNALDVVEECVLRYADHGHAFFEGLIASNVKQRWIDFARFVAPLPVVYAMLDTPMQLCYDRVMQRNGGKPLKHQELGIEKTALGATWRAGPRHQPIFEAAGLDVRTMHYQHALDETLEILHDPKLRTLGFL